MYGGDQIYLGPMLPLLLAVSLAAAQVPDSAHLVLVATTDAHGHATAWDYVAHRPYPGGLARVADHSWSRTADQTIEVYEKAAARR